jgi:hypothetical protein
MTRRPTTTQAGYGWTWQQLRLRILARDSWVCHWCGGPARSVDHVVPKVEGGSDAPANLVAACVQCNSARSLAWVRAHRGGVPVGRRRGEMGDGADSGEVRSGDPRFFVGDHVPLRSPAGFDRNRAGRGGSGRRAAATGVLAASRDVLGR